jgi:glycosyltransferase involved in cell wall biosynthesis
MISVIICTHNPRLDYFRRCIGALQEQRLPHDQWEVVAVDNCSDEPLARRIDLSWHPAARLVREDQLGKVPASLCGIRESKGDLLVFVDDDNVLDPDFLEVAFGVAEQKPFLGAWSGQCRPEFEEPPPAWTRRYWGNLVIREFDKDVWSNLPRLHETMPLGAGLCIRRAAALHYIRLHESGKRPFQLDRTGRLLLSGWDNDLAACACDVGLGMGLVASLKLTHLIRSERLTQDYLVRLGEGIFFSAVVLASLRSSFSELADYKVRWHELVRALICSGPHRKIQLACLRGRRRGLKHLAALHQLDCRC